MPLQIDDSADQFSRILGARPCAFAYGGGIVGRPVYDEAQRSFKMAFGREPGLNGLSTDLHMLKRTDVDLTAGRLAWAGAIRLGRPAK